jgi:hypothetical protein
VVGRLAHDRVQRAAGRIGARRRRQVDRLIGLGRRRGAARAAARRRDRLAARCHARRARLPVGRGDVRRRRQHGPWCPALGGDRAQPAARRVRERAAVGRPARRAGGGGGDRRRRAAVGSDREQPVVGREGDPATVRRPRGRAGHEQREPQLAEQQQRPDDTGGLGQIRRPGQLRRQRIERRRPRRAAVARQDHRRLALRSDAPEPEPRAVRRPAGVRVGPAGGRIGDCGHAPAGQVVDEDPVAVHEREAVAVRRPREP